MTVSSAAIEILEYILTVKSSSRTNGLSYDDAVNVRFEAKQTEHTDICLPYCLQISSPGLWTKAVTCKNIKDSCPSLLSALQVTERQVLDLTQGGITLIRCMSVTHRCKEIHTLWLERGCLEASQEVVPTNEDDAPEEFSITLECTGRPSHLERCARDVRNFMNKYKLVHPSVMLNFLSSSGDHVDKFEFGNDLEYSTVCNNIKIITDLSFFLNANDISRALCHRVASISEGSFVFLCPASGSSESCVSLRCVATASLIPSTATDQPLPSNVSHLWFSVFGPGSFPLVHPATVPLETLLNPKHLANWEEFGLTLASEEHGAEPTTQTQPIRGEFIPDMTASFKETNISIGTSRIVNLMLFFEKNCKGSGGSVQSRRDLLNRVRQAFPRICAQHFGKIRKIVHDTLAKVFGTRPIRKDRTVIMKAIPACASAICDIISHSTNDEFRHKCLNAMQARDTHELSERLAQHLSQVGDRGPTESDSQNPAQRHHQFPGEGGDGGGGRSESDGTNPSLIPAQPPLRQASNGSEVPEEDADFDSLDDTRNTPEGTSEAFHTPLPRNLPLSQQAPDRHTPYMLTSLSSSPATKAVTTTSKAQVLSSPRPTQPHPPPTSSSSSSSALSHPLSHHPPHLSGRHGDEGHPLKSPREAASVMPSSALSHPHSRHPSHLSGGLHGDKGSPVKSPRGAASTMPQREAPPGGTICQDEVQMMQENLSVELGNDWFDSLMDHQDWMMSNET